MTEGLTAAEVEALELDFTKAWFAEGGRFAARVNAKRPDLVERDDNPGWCDVAYRLTPDGLEEQRRLREAKR